MIKEGQQKEVKYWGKYTIKKVIHLKEPVRCYSNERGEAFFNPTLVQIKWERPPSDDKHEFYFPYWIAFKGEKEKYGQYASMMGEDTLLELLQKGIKRDLFSNKFLKNLNKTINKKINTP